MANIALTIPDASLTRVVNGICAYHGYTDLIEDVDGSMIPNPETKSQFAKRMLVTSVKNWLKNIEGEQAAAIARASAVSGVDPIDIT